MYFVAKAIKKSGIKVVLSGEGDEILGICILPIRLKIFRRKPSKESKNYSQLIYYEQIKQ
jgi:asparagine synthetase B (glutamine-hydrolysing)